MRGGLRVYTTLNQRLQRRRRMRLSIALTNSTLKSGRFASRAPQTTRSRRAWSRSIRKTGGVLALVGGRDFHASPFNRAVQALDSRGRRSPIVSAAIENGLLPALCSTIWTIHRGGGGRLAACR